MKELKIKCLNRKIIDFYTKILILNFGKVI